MKFIGVAGEMGSGKTTFSETLARNGIVQEVVGFADGVKELTKEYFNCEERVPWQIVGQGMRDLGEKILGHDRVWIDYLERKCRLKDPCETYHKYEDAEKKCFTIAFREHIFAIADVRYLNEAEWLVENGHALIILGCRSPIRHQRIERRDNSVIIQAEWDQQQRHPSETGVHQIKNLYHEEVAVPVEVFWNNTDFAHEMHLLELRFIEWFNRKFQKWLSK